MQYTDCKAIPLYTTPPTDDEKKALTEGVADCNTDFRRESLMTKLGSDVLKNLQSTDVSQKLGGDELIREKLRLIGMFTKDEGEELSDDIPLSYCMKKIITRNNLYQVLLYERNSRFWSGLHRSLWSPTTNSEGSFATG